MTNDLIQSLANVDQNLLLYLNGFITPLPTIS